MRYHIELDKKELEIVITSLNEACNVASRPIRARKQIAIAKKLLAYMSGIVIIPASRAYTIEQERALYRQAIDKWGAHSQIDQATEEAGELIVALMKLSRAENGATTAKVAGEIADVEIMAGMLKVLLALEPHAEIKAQKLQRLEGRLKTLAEWAKGAPG